MYPRDKISVVDQNWIRLVEAAGGVAKVAERLGLGSENVQRLIDKTSPCPKIIRPKVKELAAEFGVPDPCDPKHYNPSLRALELVGEGLEEGNEPSPRTIQHVKSVYPMDQLIDLAEAEDTPERVLRAIQFLLDD